MKPATLARVLCESYISSYVGPNFFGDTNSKTLNI